MRRMLFALLIRSSSVSGETQASPFPREVDLYEIYKDVADCLLTSLESWMPSGRSRCCYIISTQIKIPHSHHQGQLSHVKREYFKASMYQKVYKSTAKPVYSALLLLHVEVQGLAIELGLAFTHCLILLFCPGIYSQCWSHSQTTFGLHWLKNVILLPFATAKTISDTIYLAILPVCSFASKFIVISKVIQPTYLPTLALLAICLLPFSDSSHGQVRFVLYTKTRRTFGYQSNLGFLKTKQGISPNCPTCTWKKYMKNAWYLARGHYERGQGTHVLEVIG